MGAGRGAVVVIDGLARMFLRWLDDTARLSRRPDASSRICDGAELVSPGRLVPAVREVARIGSRQCEPRVSECTCGERDHVLSGTAWLTWLLGACPDRRGRAGGVGRCKRQVSGVKGRLVGAHEQRPPRAIGADGASSGPAEAGAGAVRCPSRGVD